MQIGGWERTLSKVGSLKVKRTKMKQTKGIPYIKRKGFKDIPTRQHFTTPADYEKRDWKNHRTPFWAQSQNIKVSEIIWELGH